MGLWKRGVTVGGGYPLVDLDGILLHCVHYSSFNEFVDKWTQRCERINWNNLFFILTERDGCTEEDIKAFDALPYKNKVVFVHKPMPEYKSAIYLPGTELDGMDGQWVRPLTSYKGRLTGRRYIDDFDYVSFFNSNSK